MSRSFYDETWTRLRATESTNGRNDKVYSFSSPATSTVAGCRLQPVSAEEVLANRWESDTKWRLLAPYGSDVTFLDRMRSPSSVDYEVTGVLDFKSPTGAAEHMEILLRKVDG